MRKRSLVRTVVGRGAALALWIAEYAAIRPVSGWLTFDVLGLPRTSRLGQRVAFFVWDAPKVLLLLTLIVFVVGIIQSFFSAQRARAILAGKRESVGNVLAALLAVQGGALTGGAGAGPVSFRAHRPSKGAEEARRLAPNRRTEDVV